MSQIMLELKKDNEFFDENRERLIRDHGFGKYVAVYKQRVVVVGDTYEEAEMKFYEKLGPNPCVIRRCVPPEEEVYQIL